MFCDLISFQLGLDSSSSLVQWWSLIPHRAKIPW